MTRFLNGVPDAAGRLPRVASSQQKQRTRRECLLVSAGLVDPTPTLFFLLSAASTSFLGIYYLALGSGPEILWLYPVAASTLSGVTWSIVFFFLPASACYFSYGARLDVIAFPPCCPANLYTGNVVAVTVIFTRTC